MVGILAGGCQRNVAGKYAGEVIREGVADGFAQYMILSSRPLSLIHIPLGDAWHFRWAHRWTASDVKKKAESNHIMDEIFS